MRINLFGASGVGTTTLGAALANQLGWTHLDADDYYWLDSDPPYQFKVSRAERNAALLADFDAQPSVILSGSMGTWGDYWKAAFDLVVFLYLPSTIRLERLRQREQQRYGSSLEHDPALQRQSQAFLEWAARYDDPQFNGRSRQQHLQWMEQLACPILCIEYDTTVEERIRRVVEMMNI